MQKSEKNRDVWYDLDNAANIFPAISDDRNTNVFRLSCELTDNVDKVVLQKALDLTMKHFGYFQVVMRRGLFWYYLEHSDITPKVQFESGRPCSRLFYKHIKELLFSVTYYRRRINLEVFHSVSDGSGAFELLRNIVYQYIVLLHKDELPHPLPPLDNEATRAEKAEDSFSHHYDPSEKQSPFAQRAYTIGGTMLPGNTIKVITGSAPTGQILALSKSKGVTVTAYLATLLICSVYCALMPKRAASRNIGITIPVDLRGHFASHSARNFFSVVDVSYNFGGAPADFDTALASVSAQLAEKLKPDALARRMNYTMGVQKNIFARVMPLAIKNFVLRAAYHKGETATTCALSNLGRVSMPQPFDSYVANFSCLLNPTPLHKLKACICSYKDIFTINFTSCYDETMAQKYFFRHLAANGVDVCITCNGVDDDEIL